MNNKVQEILKSAHTFCELMLATQVPELSLDDTSYCLPLAEILIRETEYWHQMSKVSLLQCDSENDL